MIKRDVSEKQKMAVYNVHSDNLPHRVNGRMLGNQFKDKKSLETMAYALARRDVTH